MTTLYLVTFVGILILSLISDLYKNYTGNNFEIPTIHSKLKQYKERLYEYTISRKRSIR